MFYSYDRVRVRDGVKDSDSGQDLSGLRGRISRIGYRDDYYPFTVEVYQENGSCAEYNFSADEIELEID